SALRTIALGVTLLIAVVTGLGLSTEWTTFALYWYGGANAAAGGVDPIFGRPLGFYLLSLPAWQALLGWGTTVAVVVALMAAFFAVARGGTRVLTRQSPFPNSSLRGVSVGAALVLLMLAGQVYVGRFDR